MKLLCESNILYVRASLKPFVRQMAQVGGVVEFLKEHFIFQDIFAPYFRGARLFWHPKEMSYVTTSGALGKMLVKYPDAITSRHPTHKFVGIGKCLDDVFQTHTYNTSCFFPISELAQKSDFSMLLLKCLEESPGFSTVHAVQYELGLTKRHLDRYRQRWDIEDGKKNRSIWAKESPGCSLSFGKFYDLYEAENNLIRGEILGQPYIFVKSARSAMNTERLVLKDFPRFVECGRRLCTTCRLRAY